MKIEVNDGIMEKFFKGHEFAKVGIPLTLTYGATGYAPYEALVAQSARDAGLSLMRVPTRPCATSLKLG